MILFMISRPGGRDHDPRNQFFLTLDTSNQSKEFEKTRDRQKYDSRKPRNGSRNRIHFGFTNP